MLTWISIIFFCVVILSPAHRVASIILISSYCIYAAIDVNLLFATVIDFVTGTMLLSVQNGLRQVPLILLALFAHWSLEFDRIFITNLIRDNYDSVISVIILVQMLVFLDGFMNGLRHINRRV